jgi:hypothetical protein
MTLPPPPREEALASFAELNRSVELLISARTNRIHYIYKV